MKIIAFNINGLRANIKKTDLFDMIKEEFPTIICLSETKLSCPTFDTEQIILEKLPTYKYKYYSTCSNKKGYSGTAIYSRKQPINVVYGLYNMDEEGRVITLEFNKFYLVHVYTPNSGMALARLDYRVNKWDKMFKKYLTELQETKPIIVCGDLNVANEDIDIHDPKGNKKSAGFTNEERESFKKLLNDVNLIDTYRYLYPNKVEYSYWSYRMNSRNKNKGWRIDYFLVSHNIIKNVKKSKILTKVMGSDHAPIKLTLKSEGL